METTTIKTKDLTELIRDVAEIKEMLLEQKDEMEETKLTDWAKEELEKARKRPEKDYTSLEEIKKRILQK
ncbi:MAG: hypothetical protein KKC19_04225 [Nanoarchaeota archaeon]|nr:hypothetical protein [Nanoarchaeota archaeon]